MLQAVAVHSTIVGNLAARTVVDVAREALADGLVMLAQAVGVLATGLVFAHISALLDTLGAQLTFKGLSTIAVL